MATTWAHQAVASWELCPLCTLYNFINIFPHYLDGIFISQIQILEEVLTFSFGWCTHLLSWVRYPKENQTLWCGGEDWGAIVPETDCWGRKGEPSSLVFLKLLASGARETSQGNSSNAGFGQTSKMLFIGKLIIRLMLLL